MNFVIYNQDGQILRTGSCPQSMFALQMIDADDFILEGSANDVTQYIDMVTHTVTDKPDITATLNKVELLADGEDSIIINDLPIPCTVTLDAVDYEVLDSSFEFTVDLPGEYQIAITALNHIDYSNTVTAL